MNRRTYIYCAVPLFTLLGCGATFVQLVGALPTLIVGSLLAIVGWGLLWARLSDNGKLRPEFSLLGVLPALIFFALAYTGNAGDASAFTAPVWQNFFFLFMLGSIAVQIASLCPGSKDEPRRPTQDPPFIFLSVLIIANAFMSWVYEAAYLFPIN